MILDNPHVDQVCTTHPATEIVIYTLGEETIIRLVWCPVHIHTIQLVKLLSVVRHSTAMGVLGEIMFPYPLYTEGGSPHRIITPQFLVTGWYWTTYRYTVP
jgi:hypothetical protein